MNRPNNSDFNQPTTLNDVHGRPITTDEKAYRDGYVEGRTLEQQTRYQREKVAESNGVANGIIIGGVLALIVGLGAAAIAYYNRPQVPVQRSVIVKPTTSPSSSPSPAAKQTTIIDRTIEKVTPAAPPEVKVIEVPRAVPVPVPVPAAPANTAPSSSQTAPQSSSSPSNSSSTSPSNSSTPSQADTSSNSN